MSTNGTAHAICLSPVNRGPRKRYLKVTDQRTKADFALFIRDLVDVYYPTAEKLELHYTPKHGSWLNMAEIELSVLRRQCLDRRIGSQTKLAQEVAAWQDKRNRQAVSINWRFTTADAHIKLKHLYPSLAD